jgi:hypothetical protein
MWRRALAPFLLLSLLAPGAQAQDATQELMDHISHDIQSLSVNTPIWIAQHVPAAMPSSSIGAAPEHTDGPGFAMGIVLPRLGLFNQFNEVGQGTEFLGFEDQLPGNMIWPQFGVTASLMLGIGLEASINVEGVPNMALGGDTATVEVGNFSAGGHLRWRLSPAVGPLPGIVIGVGAAYSTGTMKFGVSNKAGYTIPLQVDDGQGGFIETDVTGTYSFLGGPEMAWEMMQVAPEVRLVWAAGPVKPFIGLSVGITEGTVQGGANVTTRIEVDEIQAQGVTLDDSQTYANTSTNLFSTEPARYTVRPHVGVDFDLGALSIAAQLDVAFLNSDQLSTDVDTEALNDFDPDQEGGMFGDAQQESQSSVALVGSLAMRVVF